MATTIDDQEGGINRRDFIYIGTAAFAAIGAAAAIWTVVDQWNPDASTLSLASIEVDLAPIQAGQAITVLGAASPSSSETACRRRSIVSCVQAVYLGGGSAYGLAAPRASCGSWRKARRVGRRGVQGAHSSRCRHLRPFRLPVCHPP